MSEAPRNRVGRPDWADMEVWTKGGTHYIAHAIDGDATVGPFHDHEDAVAALAALRASEAREVVGYIVVRDGVIKGSKGGHMLACLGALYTKRQAEEYARIHEATDIEVEIRPVYFDGSSLSGPGFTE